MKKRRIVCLTLALVCALVALTSCADKTDWENVPKTTVIAKVGETEVEMDVVKYYYAELSAANKIGAALVGESFSELYKQKGKDIDTSVIYSECVDQVIAYTALFELAKGQNLQESYEDARERAYDELILASKDTTYEYYAQYLNAIMEKYTATESALCDIAAQMYVLRDSAKAYLDKIYEEGGYEKGADAVSEMKKTINEQLKSVEIIKTYPEEKKVSANINAIVEDYCSIK